MGEKNSLSKMSVLQFWNRIYLKKILIIKVITTDNCTSHNLKPISGFRGQTSTSNDLKKIIKQSYNFLEGGKLSTLIYFE
jgi:hypothetical protein